MTTHRTDINWINVAVWIGIPLAWLVLLGFIGWHLLAPAWADETINLNYSTIVRGTATISLPDHSYTYEPKDDITAAELAKILGVLMPALTCRNVLGCDVLDQIDKLPYNVKRLFVLHKDR